MRNMSAAVDLTGQRVLVLEHDYFLAMDAAMALRGAGSTVLGPFADERSALQQVASGNPTAALLDINLGAGPSFETARALARRKVPFIFLTGYDADIIPAEFSAVQHFQKPAESRNLLSCLGRLLRDERCP